MLRCFAVVAAISVGCAGCVPFTAYDLPAVDGVVRDGATQTPVAGAQIAVASKGKAEIHSAATSDSAGHFRTPPLTHTVWLPPLPFDLFVPDCTVHVSASGYADRRFDFYELLSAQRSKDPSLASEIVLYLSTGK